MTTYSNESQSGVSLNFGLQALIDKIDSQDEIYVIEPNAPHLCFGCPYLQSGKCAGTRRDIIKKRFALMCKMFGDEKEENNDKQQE